MARRQRIPSIEEQRFDEGLALAERFFMGESNVHAALRKLTRLLEEAGIPYAIVGAMALNQYGYRRMTEDVDVLLTREGLEAFKARWIGRGYRDRFAGSRGMVDTENRVPIDVVIAGEYPGDGEPKAVAFPDPEFEAEAGQRVRLLPIERLVELKIASGQSAPHRMRDLADVIELIRVAALPAEFVDCLDPSVRDKFSELWRSAQVRDPE